LALLVLLCLLLQGGPAKAAELGQPAPYHGDLASLAALNIRDARLEELVAGLDQPWAFEFISQHSIIITERVGQLRLLDLRDGSLDEVRGLPALVHEPEQTGLLDIELHPDFARNQRLYLSVAAADPETGRYFRTEVLSARLNGRQLEDVQVLLHADPIGWSPSNFGGALEFDDRGYLFISIGDRSDRDVAQQGDRLQGKILRLHDDGRTPADNPFVNQADIDPRIWALGLRNPQGLHFDAESGLLFAAEHGPMGGDEVNIIRKGRNYGWPVITYGQNYTTSSIGEGSHKAGLEQPLFYFLPSTAISPLTLYRGSMFPEWDGDLLVGALKGRHVTRLDLDQSEAAPGPGIVVRSAFDFLGEINPRVRDIKVAADGAVLVLVQAGSLYRLSRQPADQPEVTSPDGAGIPGATVYAAVCAGCHDTGAYQSPRLDNPDSWQQVRAQARSLTETHVINGKGLMPARGLCDFCSDKDLRGAIDYMLEQSQP
jgi:glucose/arabinose dehydrogenase